MSIKIYFGVPGSGKTTLAAKLVHDNLKRGVVTYSNVPIKGSVLFEAKDIGKFDISDGEMILDEAGIQFNNRKFKELSQSTIEWFKLSRHYGIRNIHVFSQSYDDMDITLRRLADEIYVVKRSIIPFVFAIRRIKVKVGIDKDTHQITDMYFFQFLGIRPYLGFHYWHMFDSWSCPDLPLVDWYLSSYPDLTIDKKHLRIVYKDIHKQGKLWFKFWSFFRQIFSRKNIIEKSARIKQVIVCLAMKLKSRGSPARSGAGRPRGGELQALQTASAKEAQSIDPDDLDAFKSFFVESPAQQAHNAALVQEKRISFIKSKIAKKK